MTLGGLQALGVLAGAIALFLRFGVIRDSSSHAAGTARESQGERGCGDPNPRTACRDCEDVR